MLFFSLQSCLFFISSNCFSFSIVFLVFLSCFSVFSVHFSLLFMSSNCFSFSIVSLVFLSCFALISLQFFLPIMSSNCFSFSMVLLFFLLLFAVASLQLSFFHVVNLFQFFHSIARFSVMFCCGLSSFFLLFMSSNCFSFSITFLFFLSLFGVVFRNVFLFFFMSSHCFSFTTTFLFFLSSFAVGSLQFCLLGSSCRQIVSVFP